MGKDSVNFDLMVEVAGTGLYCSGCFRLGYFCIVLI